MEQALGQRAVTADEARPAYELRLHEKLQLIRDEHATRHGAYAEHYPVELDERDLDDLIEHAQANYARGVQLRRALQAVRTALLGHWDLTATEQITQLEALLAMINTTLDGGPG